MEAMSMRQRSLGNLRVSAIGFGAMVLSPGMYGEVDDERAERALAHALEAGATFVDTSDGYGADHHNERLIGRTIAGMDRSRIQLATKFGFSIPEGAEAHSFRVNYSFEELSVNAEPRFVRGYAEASLERLGTDHLDLYYPHFPDPAVPIEETVAAVAELVEEGLVAHIGLSNVDAGQLRRAATVAPIATVQTEWSMWRPVDPDLLDTARELGTGIVAWGPLGSGFLTGAVQKVEESDFRRNAPRFSAENLAANVDRYAPVRAIAAELGIAPGQLALAWLLAQDDHVVPIPGSRSPAHIDENLAAAAIDLDVATLARIDEALGSVEPAGASLL
jgi:aryl-alcohol dehydrogenase-like predicted oxidoreductase